MSDGSRRLPTTGRSRKQSDLGFSLPEMMLTIGIIGIVKTPVFHDLNTLGFSQVIQAGR
jgi:prepilin-type N-terminal cleavage/methylation domain-containing protein